MVKGEILMPRDSTSPIGRNPVRPGVGEISPKSVPIWSEGRPAASGLRASGAAGAASGARGDGAASSAPDEAALYTPHVNSKIALKYVLPTCLPPKDSFTRAGP